MLSVLGVVTPIFALIFVGWLARRVDVLGPQATKELNRFVVWLALPALLFDIVANAHPSEIWQPAFIAAFCSGMFVVFLVTLAIANVQKRPLADAAIDGLNAAYANTGYMGFPLGLAAIGTAALAPTLIAAILTVCVIFAVALILIEVALQKQQHPARMVANVILSLLRNPLLVAPLLGGIVLALGLHIPAPAESFLKLLGGTASPCALVALGLFLSEKRPGAQPQLGRVALLTTLKLVAQPMVTWIFATYVFNLSAPMAHICVLLAALPTGTGPFMVAEFYGREAGVTSRVVLFSTIISLFTITAYLSFIG